jgi:hypothetical protein
MQEHPGFPCNPAILFILPVATKGQLSVDAELLVDVEKFLWLPSSYGFRVISLDGESFLWLLSSFGCRALEDVKFVVTTE